MDEETRLKRGYQALKPGEAYDQAGFAVPLNGPSRLWRGVQSISAGGLVKGALIAAALVVAVTGIVFGWGGATSSLVMGSTPVTTLEGGLAAGITTGVSFLFSGLGIAALCAGGLCGTVIQAQSNANKLTLAQAQEMAREQEALRKLQGQKLEEQQQALSAQSQPQAQPQQQQAVQTPTRSHRMNVMTDPGFEAAELRRRAEIPQPNQQQGRA